MFSLDSQSVLRVDAFSGLNWLKHGFGTRLSLDWPPQPAASVRQIHSATCLVAGHPGNLGQGDALVSDTLGLLVGVRTADCIPILLVDQRLRAVAAVHAGWRGTVQQIAVRAVEELRTRFGSRAEDLLAAIGPGIGEECYTVGPEVSCQFGLSGEAKVDLKEANRRQLEGAGVAGVYVCPLCTACRQDLFFSHRGSGGQPGRMVSAIGLR